MTDFTVTMTALQRIVSIVENLKLLHMLEHVDVGQPFDMGMLVDDQIATLQDALLKAAADYVGASLTILDGQE